MAIDAVLFDLDYTLFDSEASEREALNMTLLDNGVPPTDKAITLYKAFNKSLWEMLEKEAIDLEYLRVNRFEQLLEALDESKDPKALADTYTTNLGKCGRFYPEVKPLLERLQGKVKLAIVTNGVSETQRLRLEIHDYERYFDAIVVSGEFGIPKPNPAIFNEALNLLGLSEDRNVMMVGDSLSSDMEGARISGLISCWFNPESDRNTADVGVDYTIQSLIELVEILNIGS
ncbi:MAG: noncanonical pyrimidine nucleotidase, YjjG family [Acidimicrobiaceae bacterium]|nr:noncanonical pyrimidine nucleotidase, YjjG family [Acidimicrobiaceae bacterium]|tara:strand:- start:8521 stop:9213 length:693 start_codon:yes stop_codon:yes gene_type:complete